MTYILLAFITLTSTVSLSTEISINPLPFFRPSLIHSLKDKISEVSSSSLIIKSWALEFLEVIVKPCDIIKSRCLSIAVLARPNLLTKTSIFLNSNGCFSPNSLGKLTISKSTCDFRASLKSILGGT